MKTLIKRHVLANTGRYSVPPNLTYYVDDLEETWNYSSKFDFIYGRMLTGSLSNWPRFFEQAFEYVSALERALDMQSGILTVGIVDISTLAAG